MSRAFTKEIDDAPAPKLPPISSATNFVTPNGAALISQKAADIAMEIGMAKDSKKLDGLRRDQRYWEARRASMQIVEHDVEPKTVAFGATVLIERQGKVSHLQIVGEDEAHPAAGLIAWTSPLARALAGAEVGMPWSLKQPDAPNRSKFGNRPEGSLNLAACQFEP
jgi:transcription elongation GreA/GreB family factor